MCRGRRQRSQGPRDDRGLHLPGWLGGFPFGHFDSTKLDPFPCDLRPPWEPRLLKLMEHTRQLEKASGRKSGKRFNNCPGR